eukprot:4599093-Ditylum_brightwellii.AAC.1
MAQSEITKEDHKESFDLMPACFAQIYINGTPIAWKITREIRNTWSEKATRTDMKKCFQWKKQDFDAIDWEAS